MHPRHPTLASRLREFARARNGIAAVEFAAVLPFMLTAYLGGIEYGDGVAINRKVAVTTRSVADLASRYTTIKNADAAAILGASSSVIAPYDPGQLAVTVSEVSVDAQGNASIAWSDTLNGTARSVGSTVTLPTALNVPSTSLIWSEVSYSYKPTIGYVVTGTLNLADQIYMRPRISDSVTRVNS
jgi:Flp pilus assembly protein TadG